MAPATVVMLGDVGMGKSTVVEKVAGLSGLSSSADESFTRHSGIGQSPCRRLQICDTPGGNAMQNKLEHNVWIAHAFNYTPVSLIMLTVKADTRIDNVMGLVRNYAERFQEFSDLITVCVTHMDTVTWTRERFLNCLQNEFGLDSAIFVRIDSTGEQITNEIIQQCKPPRTFRINSENFLKLFKIHNNNLRILSSVNDEVARFRAMKDVFDRYLTALTIEQDKVDFVFEFKAFMANQIVEAQQRVSRRNNFTFMGEASAVANEASHIANLKNQLCAVLFDVRTTALAYQSQAGISDLRRCPHCGEIWAKLQGCNGLTHCGTRMTQAEFRFNSMASFTFEFDDGGNLNITKGASRNKTWSGAGAGWGKGCGKPIVWSDMAPVAVPPELQMDAVASTEDVEMLSALKDSFHTHFTNVLAGQSMRVLGAQY